MTQTTNVIAIQVEIQYLNIDIRAASSTPFMIPMLDITSEVVDLFSNESPARASRKRHCTDDDNVNDTKLEDARLESKHMEATR